MTYFIGSSGQERIPCNILGIVDNWMLKVEFEDRVEIHPYWVVSKE